MTVRWKDKNLVALTGLEKIPVTKDDGTDGHATAQDIANLAATGPYGNADLLVQTAAGYAQDAETAAGSAEGSASAAAGSASAAAGSASAAAGSASAAAASFAPLMERLDVLEVSQGDGVPGVADYADIATLFPTPAEGQQVDVLTDADPAKVGRWGYLGGAWQKSGDRVTALEGDVAALEGDVSALEDVTQAIEYGYQAPALVALAQDTTGNVLVWLDEGALDAPAAGPTLTESIGTNLGVAIDNQDGSYVALVKDEAGNVLVWLDGGALDAAALGPTLTEAIFGGTPAADETLIRRFPAAVRNLRGTNPTRQAHLWMTGDSWTERWVIPQKFSDDFQDQGFTVVATGWVGVQSTGTSDSVGSFRLLDGANLTTVGATINDRTEEAASGEYSPEGLRATFAAADTAAGFTLYWKGKTLDIYHALNGATFRHVTDGGANNDVTLTNTGAPGKTTITAAAEGWHTTVISRPTATNDLVWFGCFAGSALPGVIVSKCGNGSSTMPDISSIIGTDTAAYVIADIIPTATIGSIKRETLVRMCWLTNDSRAGVSVSAASSSLDTLLAAYSSESLFAIPAANSVSGISVGFAISEYVPAIRAACAARGAVAVDYEDRWPPHADTPFWYDSLHLSATGGGGEAMASHERRTFWESK